MKRLMLLGGSRYILPVIEAAHKLGCYVITCDYLPDNIAHKYSDEYCNVSIIDREAVLTAAKKLKVDGIMSFACDPGVITAAYVAEKMGLPSAGPYESICILQDKGRFRKFLADHGFHVPTAKAYTFLDEALKDIECFHWPVVVKPVDSAGSKGIVRVDEPAGLRQSIEHALSFSFCGRFIVEDFLQQSGYSSDTDSFSVDGELKFVSFNCQMFDQEAENPYTPAAFAWPALMSENKQKELANEIQRLITLLGLKNSIYNIETREGVDGKTYIMECSPRGGGNRLAEMLRYATGVDLIINAVKAAIGEPCKAVEQKPYDGTWTEIILHCNRAGIFRELWISDAIKHYVIETDLWVKQGANVGCFSAANAAIGTMILKFDRFDDMEAVMRNVNKYVKVLLYDHIEG